MLGGIAYSDGSRLMDDNIRAFRGIRAETELTNQKLQAEAGEKADLDTLKNIGQEFAFTQGKKLFAQYGSQIYNGNIPLTNGLSISDLDKQIGERVDTGINNLLNAASNVPNAVASNVQNALSESSDIKPYAINDSVVENTAPKVAVTNDVTISKPSAEGVQMTEQKEGFGQIDMEKPEGVNIVGEGTVEKGEGLATDEISKAGESVAAGLGENVATEEGLQATAGALASTGVLAPIAGAVEGVADIFAIYETGKSIVDWFDRDILHQTTPTADNISMPSAPQTLAQKGFLVTPQLDAYDIPHTSISNSW
jgi:hypothetical protein